MNGVLPASLLLKYASSIGAWCQMELDLGCPPWYFVDPRFLCTVPVRMEHYSPSGDHSLSASEVDHPSFAALRDKLERAGYIETQRTWHNGDRVLKPFYFNNVLLLPGDKFFSAGAWRHRQDVVKGYNSGNIDPSVKNYREEVQVE